MTVHRFSSLACLLLAALAAVAAQAAPNQSQGACTKPVYLTLDTGNMRHAELIAQILNKHQVKATFFLAQEKTFRGDQSLDDSWRDFWVARQREGHAFGSHTWRHGRISEGQDGRISYRPQFGEDAGKRLSLNTQEFCGELKRVDQAFLAHTGKNLDPIWRAPGGHTTKVSLKAAQACGYAHVHWSAAGFLGDELPSDRYPTEKLLQKALTEIRSGDILMAHLGIWSRQDPYAPALDPLIEGLKKKGFCFKTILEHPGFKPGAESVAATR